MKVLFFKSLLWSYMTLCCLGLRIHISKDISVNNCSQILDLVETKVHHMSQQWHNFTKGTLRIEKVLISVPGKFKKCIMHKTTVPFEDQNEESADIQVVPSGVLTSTQYGPCGTRGKTIQLPLSNLNETDDDYKDGSSSTNLLLRTWINSNYGVFLESLHPDIWHSNESTTGISKNSQQELLCHGKSVREVVQLLHPQKNLSLSDDDFFQRPLFTYQVQPKKRAYVIIIQKSFPEFDSVDSSINSIIPWETVQSALLPFITSLSSGDQLAIVTYDQDGAEINLPITELTDENRPLLHAAIPRRSVPNRHLSLEACHHCGLNEAKKIASAAAYGASESPSNPNDIKFHHIQIVRSGKVAKEHLDWFQAINPSVIGLDRSLDHSWSEVSNQIRVIDQCEEKRLCQAFIAQHLLETIDSQFQLKFHEPNVVGGTTKAVTFPSSAKTAIVIATADNERDIASLSSTSPSGEMYTYPFYTNNMAYMILSAEGRGRDLKQHNLEEGQWNIDCQMYSEKEQVTIDVLVMSENPSEQKPLEAWVDSRTNHAGHPQITIYARSTTTIKGKSTIVAQISRPGHMGKELSVVEIPLLDSGSGYPDIRSNDQIYSAYFTELSPEAGFYQVLVQVQDDQGVVIHRVHAEAFHVAQMPSGFYVRKEPGSRLLISDVFPPNRITDLGVVGVVGDAQLFVTLNWTAPGGDFDHGKAFRYEIRCATSSSALQEDTYMDQSIPVHASLIPQPDKVGTIQRCTVGVPWHNQNFYYGILAYDASGNRGLISNTVFVMVIKEETNEIMTGQKHPESVMTKETSAGGALPQSTRNDTKAAAAVYIWVPIVIVLLVTFLIGSGLTIVYRRNCPSKEYHCSAVEGGKNKIQESEWSSSSSHDESRSTTTSAGVSTNLTIEDDLSIVDQKVVEDVWTTTTSSSSSGTSGPPSFISNSLEPRIHVMEDFTVYRDLSTISDVPSEYCHLDLMLSALLASNQRLQQQQHRQQQQQQKQQHMHNESLV